MRRGAAARTPARGAATWCSRARTSSGSITLSHCSAWSLYTSASKCKRASPRALASAANDDPGPPAEPMNISALSHRCARAAGRCAPCTPTNATHHRLPVISAAARHRHARSRSTRRRPPLPAAASRIRSVAVATSKSVSGSPLTASSRSPSRMTTSGDTQDGAATLRASTTGVAAPGLRSGVAAEGDATPVFGVAEPAAGGGGVPRSINGIGCELDERTPSASASAMRSSCSEGTATRRKSSSRPSSPTSTS